MGFPAATWTAEMVLRPSSSLAGPVLLLVPSVGFAVPLGPVISLMAPYFSNNTLSTEVILRNRCLFEVLFFFLTTHMWARDLAQVRSFALCEQSPGFIPALQRKKKIHMHVLFYPEIASSDFNIIL
jgi:hypothetical protein